MSKEVKFQDTSSQGDIAVQGALKIGLNVLKGMMLLLIVLWLFSGVYIVKKGEAAVVYYMGQIQPYEGENVRKENVYWGLPFPFTKVIKEKVNQGVSVNLDLYELEDSTKGNTNEDPVVKAGRPYNITKDMSLIHLSWGVEYKIKELDFFILSFYKEGDMNRGRGKDKPWRDHARKLIETVTRGIVVAQCSQYKASEILTSRVNFNQSVLEKLQLQLDKLKTGLEITQLKLIKAKPPLSLWSSYEGVSNVKSYNNQMLSRSRKISSEIKIRTESIINKITVDEDNAIREMKKNVATEALKLKELLRSFKGDSKMRKNYMEQVYLKTVSNMLFRSKIEYINNHKRLRYKTTIFPEDKVKDKAKNTMKGNTSRE